MSEIYTIRQLTKEFGVTARTLRFYQDEELIAPQRRGQTRLYSKRDRARIIMILRGRRIGFSLAEIREILNLYDPENGGLVQLAHVRRKFEERLVALEVEKRNVEDSIRIVCEALKTTDERLNQTRKQDQPSKRAA